MGVIKLSAFDPAVGPNGFSMASLRKTRSYFTNTKYRNTISSSKPLLADTKPLEDDNIDQISRSNKPHR
jgi:hypothetical protein